MWTPTSCRIAAYSSHSRSRSVSPWMARVWSKSADGEARDLLRVLGPVVAALGELEHAAPADVGIAVGLRDFLAMPRDVVEDQPSRSDRSHSVISVAPSRRRISSIRIAPATARSARRGSSPGTRSRCSRSSAVSSLRDAAQLLGRDAPVAKRCARRCPFGRGDHGAEAQNGARRADDPVEAGAHDLIEIAADLGVDMPRRACAGPCRRSDRS